MNSKDNINIEIAEIKNLPPLPETSVKILAAVNNPDISIDELVEILTQSPPLMARLIGLANSAYFGRTGQIKDLRVAIIQVLGLNLVKSLALSIVLNVELNTSKCKLFDADFFWKHTLLSALIAQKLSIYINDELMTPGVVYTSALLLNIGLLAAAYIHPTEVNEVFSQSERIESSVSTKMTELLGHNQYEMGGVLLEKWQLPESYQTVVKEFKQNTFIGKERTLINLLTLSHRLGGYIVTDNLEEIPDCRDLLHSLALSPMQFEIVVTDILNHKENINELAKIISG